MSQDIFGGHKQGYQNVGLVLENFQHKSIQVCPYFLVDR